MTKRLTQDDLLALGASALADGWYPYYEWLLDPQGKTWRKRRAARKVLQYIRDGRIEIVPVDVVTPETIARILGLDEEDEWGPEYTEPEQES